MGMTIEKARESIEDVARLALEYPGNEEVMKYASLFGAVMELIIDVKLIKIHLGLNEENSPT